MKASDAITGIEDFPLEEDEFVQGSIVIIKTSRLDGSSAVRRAYSTGMSHWEVMGMTLDALIGWSQFGEWE